MSKTKFKIRVSTVGGDEVELCISRKRLAAALFWSVFLPSEERTPELVLHEMFPNGDTARITFERVSWREVPWRMTNRGYVKGPYRVWQEFPAHRDSGCWAASFEGEPFTPGPFETPEDAKAAAMRHADTTPLPPRR